MDERTRPVRLKDACVDAGQYGVNVSPDEYRTSGVRMLRTSDLAEQGLTSEEDGVFLGGPIPPAQVLHENDLLLSRAGTIGRSYLVPASGAGRTYAGFLIRFRPQVGFNPRFLQYSLRSKPTQDQINAEAVTSTIQNFNAERYANLSIPDASLEEQRRIADFLDDRVARIDHIIGSRRSQLTALDEIRSSLVAEAVGSVDVSDVPIWMMARGITDGAHVSPETEGGEFDFVSTRDVSAAGDIDFDGSLKTTEASYRVLERQGCQPHSGDLLFSKDGTVGRTALVNEDRPFVVASSLIIIRPDSTRVDAGFLHYMFKEPRVVAQVDAFVKGAGLPGISIANLKRVVGVFPELSDQRQLRVKLDRHFSTLRTQQDNLVWAVALLQEYKQSLITAAVTGELDVTTASTDLPS